jgi:hypothetical protein
MKVIAEWFHKLLVTQHPSKSVQGAIWVDIFVPSTGLSSLHAHKQYLLHSMAIVLFFDVFSAIWII